MKTKLRWWMGLLLLAAACGQVNLDVVTPTLPPVATVAPTPTPPVPTDPAATPTDPAPAPTEAPSATPDNGPVGQAPVEGLTYSGPDGIYWVDATGQVVKIFERPAAAISPDKTQALYAEGDDLWLADLGTGEARNLTNTPDRVEHSPQWWPARPDLVVFGSYPVGRELGFGPALFPSVMKLDGSEYRVLDEETDAFTLALSPDGRTLAYGLGPTGFLYDLESGTRAIFDPQAYGAVRADALPRPANWSVAGPAFSPDGLHLSWTLGQFFEDGTNQNTLMIVDLAARTSTLMHVYHVPPSDYVPVAGVWSPDGQWVAYYTLADDPAELGMWVAHVSGGEERYLGAGNGGVWRADGGWLAYNGDQGNTVIYRAEDWSATSFSGPVNGGVIGW